MDLNMNDVRSNKRKVENTYKKALNKLKENCDTNIDKMKELKGKEAEIKDKIIDYENKIKAIRDNDINYVNGEKATNRLKSIGLEKVVFDYETNIEILKRNLEWKKKKNEIELQFLKKKCEDILDEYSKLYEELDKINNNITVGVLGEASAEKYGDIINAKRFKEENDQIFKNLLQQLLHFLYYYQIKYIFETYFSNY